VAAWDLILGVTVLVLLSGVLFRCGWIVAHRAAAWLAGAIAVATFAGTVAFATTLHGQLSLARMLPFSNAIVLGNWIPLGAALLMGIVARQRTVPRWRRLAVSGMLAALAWYTVGYDLLARGPKPRPPRFSDGFCMQTTSSSCSACCAAALLMYYEIPATEGEMMDLCLTRLGGTPELGLYRGVTIKTRRTALDVEVMRHGLESLRQVDGCPALLLVDAEDAVGPETGNWWRANGPDHAIVVYGFADDGKVEVGDPSCGLDRWTMNELRRRWHGDGLRLVRQAGSATGSEAVSKNRAAADAAGDVVCRPFPTPALLKDGNRSFMNQGNPDSDDTADLLQLIQAGKPAFDQLFARHRESLRRSVALRFDPTLRARADPSDVVQETQMEAFRRLPDYVKRQPMPFHLWLRKMAYERLIMLRRKHLDASRRAVRHELPLPEKSSVLLAQKLLASDRSPSEQVSRQELAQRVRLAVGQLPENDREILLMRTYEALSYEEIACLLEIEPAAARKRHGRALIHLHKLITAGGISESQV
jgi:RNA polymerase sigma-70 factor (subfamily 1)